MPAYALGLMPCASALEVTGEGRCWGPAGPNACFLVLFSLELFFLELEDQLTGNLLTKQFSPLLKASCMPVHVWSCQLQGICTSLNM